MNQTGFNQPASRISVMILAGGRAIRMGGQDKGLTPLLGQPLAQRLYQQIKSQTQPINQYPNHSLTDVFWDTTDSALLLDDILINANRNLDTYRQLFPQCQVISDQFANYCGPLAGIHSALQHCHYDQLLVIPCDLLLLPAQSIARFMAVAQQNPTRPVYALINQQPLYPFCLVHKQHQSSLENQLKQQHYAVRHWLFDQQATKVEFSLPMDCPSNINSLQLLQQAEQFLQHYSLQQHPAASIH